MSILLQDNLWIPPESRIYKLAEKMHTSQERITMQLLILLIWLSAISIIFYAFFRALTLTKKIPGGLVKQSWKLLYYLIGLLGVGYLTMPLFSRLPETSRDFIIGVVSLAGAVFILKVINLFYKIIKEVGL
jgi:hypothetical protein